jgi:hypothetical protein
MFSYPGIYEYQGVAVISGVNAILMADSLRNIN